MLDLHKTWGGISDDEWEAIWTTELDTSVVGSDFPSFPSSDIQIQFVGSAHLAAMAEAMRFYRHVKSIASSIGRPLSPDMKFLDFGCGWGRFLRVFCKDFKAENLFGVDIDPDIIALCRRHNVPGQLECITPDGPIPDLVKSVDFAIAYSVFTHLPEHIHLHWMEEIAAKLVSGGLFCLTLEPRRFLDFVGSASTESPSEWQRGMAQFSNKAKENMENFDAGNFVYLPSGGGDYRPSETYGDAVVPIEYIEAYWNKHFRIISYVDNPGLFWQAVLVVQKR